MKSPEKLPPIPTPVAQRIRRLRMSVLPALVVCTCLVMVGNLWQDRIGVTPVEVGPAPWATKTSPSQPRQLLTRHPQLEGLPLAAQPASQLEGKSQPPAGSRTGWNRLPTDLGDTNIITAVD